jgi:hypothetical protein
MALVGGGPIGVFRIYYVQAIVRKTRSLMHLKAKFNLLFYKYYWRSNEGGAGAGRALTELLRFGPPYLVSLCSKTTIANRCTEW